MRVLPLLALCLASATARAAAPDAGDHDTAPPAGEPGASPLDSTYLVEAIDVRGNRRTRTEVILAELGLRPGDVVGSSDPRVEAARLRLLSLGYFLDVRLHLDRGSRRGAARLVVHVEERGTLIVNSIYLGSSEATALWAGVDVSEINLFGRGLVLGAGVVGSTRPVVPEAEAGRGVTLRASGPAHRGVPAPSAELLFVDGSEFVRAFGDAGDADPDNFVAFGVRRLGLGLGATTDLSRTLRVWGGGRFEAIRARSPSLRTRDLGGGRAKALDLDLPPGSSRLASLALSLDLDGRSDPIMPAAGHRVFVSVEAALPVLGARYTHAKGVIQASIHHRVIRQHVLTVHGLLGGVFGQAPYFDQFYVGDLNYLLPPRALGLAFSTLPSRNFLGTSVDERRYEPFAGRVVVEYAVPLWRGRGLVYRGQIFAAAGAFALASQGDLRARDGGYRRALPVDLTADAGVRLDTWIGIFSLSFANALGRVPL
jgi:hypothetical protein